MDWFLYDNVLRHERVKIGIFSKIFTLLFSEIYFLKVYNKENNFRIACTVFALISALVACSI